MLFKISLVNNQVEEQLSKNVIDADTAQTIFKDQTDVINTVIVGTNVDGTTKLKYNTGFLEDPIKRDKYYSNEEKLVLLQSQKEAKIKLIGVLSGNESLTEKDYDKNPEKWNSYIDPTNKFFWEKHSKIEIKNDTPNLIFDTTKSIDDLIKYWQIQSTAFNLIGNSIDDALFRGCSYFLDTVEGADNRQSEVENKKLEAHAKIHYLREEGNIDKLVYLCWSLGDRYNFMMGFNKSTSLSTLTKALYDFVEGNTTDKNKKNNVNLFLDAHKEYTLNQDKFMSKVFVKIADFHSLLNLNKDKEYTTTNGVAIGKTLEEASEFLLKGKNKDIYDELVNEVKSIINNV